MKIDKKTILNIIKEEMYLQRAEDFHDNEPKMAKKQLFKLYEYAKTLHDALPDDLELESWVQSKITMASDYIGKVKHHLEYELNIDMDSQGCAGPVAVHEDKNK
tara:strand:- start:257 stop:568 length:312 start_codon:yes stop_codon:yes gene_type:complete